MQRKSVQLSCCAIGLLLLSLSAPTCAWSQEQGPCNPSWYEAVPPNPDWGLPPTLGQMFPLHLYDTQEVKAGFLVPLEGLQSLLPPGVRALEARAVYTWLDSQFSGFGVFFVAFQEHNSMEYGEPYHEGFGMVMVEDPSWSEGFSAWYPVYGTITSEAAQWWGMAAFGYAKILGDAHHQPVEPKGFKAFASADGELIARMEVDAKDMAPAPLVKTMFLSVKDGSLVRVPAFETAASRYVSWTIGASTIKLGEHPIAQQLRATGLGMYPSIQQIWSKNLQVTVEKGTCEPLTAPGAN